MSEWQKRTEKVSWEVRKHYAILKEPIRWSGSFHSSWTGKPCRTCNYYETKCKEHKGEAIAETRYCHQHGNKYKWKGIE